MINRIPKSIELWIKIFGHQFIPSYRHLQFLLGGGLSPGWWRAEAAFFALLRRAPFFAADFVFVFRFFAMPASRLAGCLHKPCNKSKVQMINAAAELSSFDQPT
jgi:hypothetical protein